jgi:A/G-specific adenine glycosylase
VGQGQRGAARQDLLDPDRRRLTGALLDWYGRAGRDLPWRRTRDPYRILVSEVMLQQTQVARVVPRYEAWIERWPDAAALAAAPVAEVLRAWVGLGYNRRALRLREAAVVVARDGWPEDLRALPGVGRTRRRRWGLRLRPRRGRPGHEPAPGARAHGRRARPAAGQAVAFNNAIMDLGATVCTARRPRCEACPLACGWTPPRPAEAGSGAPRAPRARFEDTDRYVRGRVVAALAAGEALPAQVGEARLERALAGLERDGLVVRGDGGAVRLLSR